MNKILNTFALFAILPIVSWASEDSVVGIYEFREPFDDLIYFLVLKEDNIGYVREVAFGYEDTGERRSEIDWRRKGSRVMVSELQEQSPLILRGRTEFRIGDDGSLTSKKVRSRVFKFEKSTANKAVDATATDAAVASP